MADDEEHPIINDRTRIMLAEVVRAARIAPAIAEITLAGEDLRSMPDLGPDQFLYVFAPRPGEERPAVDHDFTWDHWRELPEDDRPVGRYYTVRRARLHLGEVDIQVVLHGHGPLSTWGATAGPGGAVALWGPRASFRYPPDAPPVLLAADASGLPALAAILESLPETASGDAYVEIDEGCAGYELAQRPGIRVVPLDRGQRAHGAALTEAVTAAKTAPETYAWIAGENEAVTRIRQHLRRTVGLPVSSVCAIGYWHR